MAERGGGCDLGGSEAAECREVMRTKEGRRRECLGDPNLSVVRGRVLRRRAVVGAVGVDEAVEGVARGQPQPEEGV